MHSFWDQSEIGAIDSSGVIQQLNALRSKRPCIRTLQLYDYTKLTQWGYWQYTFEEEESLKKKSKIAINHDQLSHLVTILKLGSVTSSLPHVHATC